MNETSPKLNNESSGSELSLQAKTKKNRTLAIILGILFILPALTVFIFTRIIPTIMTFVQSFRESSIYGSAQFVGFSNYERLFSTSTTGSILIFTLLLTVNRVLVVLIPPLLLALGASAVKSKLRKVIRVISTLPWVVYSPIAISIIWLLVINPNFGIGFITDAFYNLETSRWLVLFLDGLSFFGLSCGLGLTVYLSAIKGANRDGNSKGLVKSLAVLAVILILGTIAVSLQGGENIVFVTNGFPDLTTMSIYPYISNLAFSLMQTGLAAALTSPLIIIVALLGIAVSLFMIISNTRLFNLPKKSEPAPMSKGLKIFSVIMMVLILLDVLFTLSPYLLKPILASSGEMISSGGVSNLISELPFWRSLLNTWIGPLAIVLLIQFPVTYLAALGIGALRPFGKSSEWLLLLFAPWLFVRVMLYLPGVVQTILSMNLYNSYIGLALPYILNIPMLFILTLFFRGQTRKFAEKGEEVKFFRDFVLASLPLALICIVFSIMFIQQELSWSTVILSSSDKWMLPILFKRIKGLNMARIDEFAKLITLVRIPAAILGFIILGAYQLFYFPILGISVGREKNKKQTS